MRNTPISLQYKGGTTMNDRVKKILTENNWCIATYGETVNVVPIGIKAVEEDGRLIAADNFMNKTKANIQKTGLVSVAAYDPATGEGYQVKGTAQYIGDGELFQKWHDEFEKTYSMAPKGIVVIRAAETYVLTPGEDNGKKL